MGFFDGVSEKKQRKQAACRPRPNNKYTGTMHWHVGSHFMPEDNGLEGSMPQEAKLFRQRFRLLFLIQKLIASRRRVRFQKTMQLHGCNDLGL